MMRDSNPQSGGDAIGRFRPRGQPLRVGIVGCGRVAETCHLPALRGLAGTIEVAAVADVDEHRRLRVAGMFGVPRALPDVDALLRQTDVDVVAVCTPAAAHADDVASALRAGKHVLLEKPVALTLDDADRIVAEAAARPDLKVMLGFNLRHHRLVRRARQLIVGGTIGEVRLLRTAWTSGIRQRLQVPAWRNRRDSGGGVLSEIAVHHVDLIRHLTGADVKDVFTRSHHGEGDDETAALVMSLSSGATASCVFSESLADSNEMEIFGTRGRLTFSIYRFDSLVFTPTGEYGGRLRHLVQAMKDLPEVWPILRRGGDFLETYREEWLALRRAILADEPVPATVEDGREALRVVLAAGASANAATPVAIQAAPGRPEPVPPDAPRDAARAAEPPAPIEDPTRPRLSAILATRGSFETIRHTVRHLRAQTVRRDVELIIVCPSQRLLGLDPAAVDGFHACRVVEVGPIGSRARPNAAGIRAAAAPVIVLCEDHAFPEPTWAEALIRAHRGPYAVVGPGVRNANPGSTVSWADCLIGYGPWLLPIHACEPPHLPGHNSSYKREVLLAGYDHCLDDMMEAETVLQWDLRARGHRLYLDPSAVLAHTNFAQLGVWTKVQFHAGRMFAATRAAGWPLWKRVVFTCGSPLIPLVRLKRIWSQARRISGDHRLLPRVLPALLWGLTMDGLGQMAGYATGAGISREKIADYEYERIRYITDEDRRALADDVARARAARPVQLEQTHA